MASFLWFQLVAGWLFVAESLFHLRVIRGERSARDWWNLAVAAAVASIATLELFFVAYHPWLPDAAVWSTLLTLDVLAVFLYMGRIDTSPELIDDLEEEGGVSREADPAVVAGP